LTSFARFPGLRDYPGVRGYPVDLTALVSRPVKLALRLATYTKIQRGGADAAARSTS